MNVQKKYISQQTEITKFKNKAELTSEALPTF